MEHTPTILDKVMHVVALSVYMTIIFMSLHWIIAAYLGMPDLIYEIEVLLLGAVVGAGFGYQTRNTAKKF